jgi:hypothetical protein
MKKHTRRNKQNTRSISGKTWWRIRDVYASKLPSLLEVICAVHDQRKYFAFFLEKFQKCEKE